MRTLRTNTYVAALVISLLLFGTGMLAGLFIANQLTDSLAREINEVRLRTTEIELLFLIDADNVSCAAYGPQLELFDNQTAQIDRRVDILSSTRGATDPDVLTLKREFTIMQLRDYLFAQKINKKCNQSVDTLLYFYGNNCAECDQQGSVGPELKRDHPQLRIYAFDADLSSPAVTAIMQQYGVKSYPTIVVNGLKLEGYKSKQEIEAVLAKS